MSEEEKNGIIAPIPVKVMFNVTPQNFEQILRMTPVWWEDIKPKLDLARFIESRLRDARSFYIWFYENLHNMTPEELVKKLREEMET